MKKVFFIPLMLFAGLFTTAACSETNPSDDQEIQGQGNGHMATTMQSFLHSHANLLSGKRIAIFASSGSSSINTSVNEARSLVSDVEFTETLHLTRNTIEDMGTRIPAWLEQLGASREEDEISGNSIRLTIEGGAEFTATLVENSSTQALKTHTASHGSAG